MDAPGTMRTVHVVLPVTHRSLCGYQEESPAPAEGAVTVACPECSALLRSGFVKPPAVLHGRR